MTTTTRRGFLLGAAGAAVGACTTAGPPAPRPSQAVSGAGTVLLAYFSRAGENYHNGGRRQLTVGNTEAVAGMISRLIGCDVHRIEAADPYPQEYRPTVERNVREQAAGTRPEIANPFPATARHTTVLLGSPIWNVHPPMIMTTFAEAFDFTATTVHPFVTYAVSGLGDTERVYADTCRGASLAESLAVRGEDVADGSPDVQTDVEAWLRRIGLRTG